MSDTKEQGFFQKHEARIMWGLVIFAVVALVVVLGFYIARFHELNVVTDPEKLGVFGDYVGGVLNPIFAFLAFLILMLSFRLQSKEMSETKEELKKASAAQVVQAEIAQKQLENAASQFNNTIEFQKKQSELVSKQIEQINIQNFENLFFKLIDISIHLRNKVEIPEEIFNFDNEVMLLSKKIGFLDREINDFQRKYEDNQKYNFSGKDYYSKNKEFSSKLKQLRRSKSKMESRQDELEGIILYLSMQKNRNLEVIIDVFELQVQHNTWEEYITSGIANGFNEYLKVNFQILEFISVSLDFEGGKKYAEIYKSQLMDYELAALFWSTADSKKYINLKVLIEEFAILEFLSWTNNQHGFNCRIEKKHRFKESAFEVL